jgi:hypothetical protein
MTATMPPTFAYDRKPALEGAPMAQSCIQGLLQA